MTHRIINTFILCLFIAVSYSSIQAQVVESVRISGNKAFDENEYLRWSGINTGIKFYNGITDTIQNRISSNLTANGFFNFNFEKPILVFSPDSQKVSITIEINEGSPSNIRDIDISGLDRPDSLLAASYFQLLKGNVFSKPDFEESVSSLLDYYENNGYPFAVVRVESVTLQNDTSGNESDADVHLYIDKGQVSSIDKIEITGNTKTKDDVIIRNLRIQPGEKYSEKLIDNVPAQLNRLSFFDPVEKPEFYINADKEGVLKIKIKEKETNNFDGIIGYVPPGNNKSGYFTGYFNVSLRNLFGTGRAAAIRWQQQDQSSQELELKYLEPWIFGFPVNIQTGLFQRKQDSTYVQRNFNISLEYLATDEISASLLFSSESTIPTENSSGRFTVFNSTSLTSGVNLKIDTRNDVYAPTGGIYFLNTYKYSSKTINGPEKSITENTIVNSKLQRLEMDIAVYYEFLSRQIAALSVHARELRGDNFEISDLYFLGGANTLRGYRENQFSGNRVLWSNLEYRYLLTKRTFAFLFFDTGYYLRNENALYDIEKTSAFKTGYGFGLNIETSLGILGVSFALGNGDSFSEGKIHFGIVNEF